MRRASFGRLWYGEPNAISNAIGYAKFRSRSHDAVIRVFDASAFKSIVDQAKSARAAQCRPVSTNLYDPSRLTSLPPRTFFLTTKSGILRCLLFDRCSEDFHSFPQLGNGCSLLLNFAMLFEELVEQHRIHRLVAHGVGLAFSVAHHEVRIHFFHLLSHETEPRDALRGNLFFVTEGDRFKRETSLASLNAAASTTSTL